MTTEENSPFFLSFFLSGAPRSRSSNSQNGKSIKCSPPPPTPPTPPSAKLKLQELQIRKDYELTGGPTPFSLSHLPFFLFFLPFFPFLQKKVAGIFFRPRLANKKGACLMSLLGPSSRRRAAVGLRAAYLPQRCFLLLLLLLLLLRTLSVPLPHISCADCDIYGPF